MVGRLLGASKVCTPHHTAYRTFFLVQLKAYSIKSSFYAITSIAVVVCEWKIPSLSPYRQLLLLQSGSLSNRLTVVLLSLSLQIKSAA